MSDLINRYLKVRQQSARICQPLEPEDYTPQSAEFASPPKWHLAHTTWFFEELILKQHLPYYEVFDASFSFLFNSYYNALGERIPRNSRGLITRPGIEKVYEYRRYVDEHMIKLIEQTLTDDISELIILGLNHEQQHQELMLTDFKYTLSINPTYPKYQEQSEVSDYNNQSGWASVKEGVYEIGHQGDGFHYDNEKGKHKVYLEAYEISKSLVTNQEFISFIENGGYSNPSYWLDDGWAWLNDNKIQHPLYWRRLNGTWYQFTLAGLQKIDSDTILSHVSLYEAAAFASYENCRLPTEAEWEVAANQFDWGKRWEWTNSAYLPYPRFQISPGAVGEYNGKFMMNQMVLRGGSVATAEGHSRASYRNFFHPDARWQYSGIRLAR